MGHYGNKVWAIRIWGFKIQVLKLTSGSWLIGWGSIPSVTMHYTGDAHTPWAGTSVPNQPVRSKMPMTCKIEFWVLGGSKFLRWIGMSPDSESEFRGARHLSTCVDSSGLLLWCQNNLQTWRNTPGVRCFFGGYLRPGNLGWHGKPPHLLHSWLDFPRACLLTRAQEPFVDDKTKITGAVTGYGKAIKLSDRFPKWSHPPNEQTYWTQMVLQVPHMFADVRIYSPTVRRCNHILTYVQICSQILSL